MSVLRGWKLTLIILVTLGIIIYLNSLITSKPNLSLLPKPSASEQVILQDLVKNINQISDSRGAKEAWNYLQQSNPNVDSIEIHNVAHLLGIKLYQQLGLESLQVCDQSFSYGCYHGVVEEFIKDKGVEDLSQAFEKCQSFGKAIERNCYHGIGHGVLPYFKYDLNQSIAFCERLNKGDLDDNCRGGVFMEKAFSLAGQTDKPVDTGELCYGILERFRGACWRYQMVVLTFHNHNDYSLISLLCHQSKESKDQLSCLKSLSFFIAQRSIQDLDQVKSDCNQLKFVEDRYLCLTYSAEEIVYQSKQEGGVGNKFCNSLPSDWKKKCQSGVSMQLSGFTTPSVDN